MEFLQVRGEDVVVVLGHLAGENREIQLREQGLCPPHVLLGLFLVFRLERIPLLLVFGGERVVVQVEIEQLLHVLFCFGGNFFYFFWRFFELKVGPQVTGWSLFRSVFLHFWLKGIRDQIQSFYETCSFFYAAFTI